MGIVKIVVADEHTMGYIDEGDPDYLYTYREMQTLGAPFHVHDGQRFLGNYKNIRPAVPADFPKFRVCENQFRHRPGSSVQYSYNK